MLNEPPVGQTTVSLHHSITERGGLHAQHQSRCQQLLHHTLPCVTCRLDYGDVICDGFYDIEGDFPEITDNPADFPTIAALRHVRCFEADPREVSGIDCVCVGGGGG